MRNIILISLLFIYSCGYTTVYKDLEKKDFQVNIIKMSGDRQINNQIKNQINLYSTKNSSNEFNISIDSKYKKIVLAKNSNGSVSDYQLSINSTFTIYVDNETTKETFYETINIKNQTNNFEQRLYEDNIKKNFASSIREKFISKILILK